MNSEIDNTAAQGERRAKFLTDLEEMRAQLHEKVDRSVDEMIEQIRAGEELTFGVSEALPQSRYLFGNLSEFKGKKPLSVTLPDGRIVETRTWKQLATEILRDCNGVAEMHGRLLEMSGKVFGRDRVILGGDAGQMDVPLKIDDDLYMEGKFDTESLLYVLTERVLRPAGYDYSGIRIEYSERQPVLSVPTVEKETQEQEQPAPGMDIGQTMY